MRGGLRETAAGGGGGGAAAAGCIYLTIARLFVLLYCFGLYDHFTKFVKSSFC